MHREARCEVTQTAIYLLFFSFVVLPPAIMFVFLLHERNVRRKELWTLWKEIQRTQDALGKINDAFRKATGAPTEKNTPTSAARGA